MKSKVINQTKEAIKIDLKEYEVDKEGKVRVKNLIKIKEIKNGSN